jgi:hypothetical protein
MMVVPHLLYYYYYYQQVFHNMAVLGLEYMVGMAFVHIVVEQWGYIVVVDVGVVDTVGRGQDKHIEVAVVVVVSELE